VRRASAALLVLVLAALAWWLLWPQTLPAGLRGSLPVSPAAEPPMLYKWKDAKGQWQVSDRPPATGSYEAVRIDPDTNVLPAGVPPEQDD